MTATNAADQPAAEIRNSAPGTLQNALQTHILSARRGAGHPAHREVLADAAEPRAKPAELNRAT
jgi:hypothetical protein